MKLSRRVHRISKCAVSVIMITALLLGNVTNAATFEDVSASHWASEQIQQWIDRGLIEGYPDGTFRPDETITRAEFMVLVNGGFGFRTEQAIHFTDVKTGSWYETVIKKAAAAAYIVGYEDGTIRPNQKISRQEAAVIIARIAKLEGDEAAAAFPDPIPQWSRAAIGAVAKQSYMQGYPDGSFGATKWMTRAEAVVALDNVLKAKLVTSDKDPDGDETESPMNSGEGAGVIGGGGGNSGGNGGAPQDTTPPVLSNVTSHYVNIGDVVSATSNKNGHIYLVARATVTTATYDPIDALHTAAGTASGVKIAALGNEAVNLSTAGLAAGYYVVYAVDAADRISSASAEIAVVPVGYTAIATSEQDLKNIGQNLNERYIQLNDIDLVDEWEPAGTFAGIYDGNGYAITSLTINSIDDNIGLFKATDQHAIVRNVRLEGVTIEGFESVGALAGTNMGTIENSYATGTVKGGGRFVGGLVGYNSGSIASSYASGDVEGTDYVGGLTGTSNDGSITASYAAGSVKGTNYVGGLVGDSFSSSTIISSYSVADVEGNAYVGGLVGRNLHSVVESSYANGKAVGHNSVGGLIGISVESSVAYSFAAGEVEGAEAVGGLVGYNITGTISRSYALNSKIVRSAGNDTFFGRITGDNDVVLPNNNYANQHMDPPFANAFNGMGDGENGIDISLADAVLRATFKNNEWSIEADANDPNPVWDIDEGTSFPFLRWEIR